MFRFIDCAQGHLAAAGEEACSTVETRLLPAEAVANRGRLQAEADAWLQELGETPPGNGKQASLWQVIFWDASPCQSTQSNKQLLGALVSIGASCYQFEKYIQRLGCISAFVCIASSVPSSGLKISCLQKTNVSVNCGQYSHI